MTAAPVTLPSPPLSDADRATCAAILSVLLPHRRTLDRARPTEPAGPANTPHPAHSPHHETPAAADDRPHPACCVRPEEGARPEDGARPEGGVRLEERVYHGRSPHPGRPARSVSPARPEEHPGTPDIDPSDSRDAVDTPEHPDGFPHQLRVLERFVAADDPVLFTLPGFPCKSPNPAKVLGHLPDEGERLALRFLDELCARISEVYAPGARVLICSDGHVFGDLIHVPDTHIDAYNDALRAMIRELGLAHLDTFDLRDVHGDRPAAEKRARVHERYAPALEDLRAQTRTDEETARLYRGITRFLFEDTASFDGSRSALQRDCRRRAYGVIQRSRAWGELIDAHHPGAFRLSIHPQPRGAAKFGIRLLQAPDVWMTPWHASVLRGADGQPRLMRRADAERLGRLVLHQGRPSHFEAVV